MENGELLAADVLPKVAKEMKKVAAVGLEDKLDTLRVAQGQFNNQLEKTMNFIFQGKFSEGLKDLFQSLTEDMQGSEDGLNGLSETFKLAFNVIRNASEILLPVLNEVFSVLGGFSKFLNMVFDSDLGKILLGMAAMAMALKRVIMLTNLWKKATKSAMVANILASIPPKALAVIAAAVGTGAVVEDVSKTLAGNDKTALSRMSQSMFQDQGSSKFYQPNSSVLAMRGGYAPSIEAGSYGFSDKVAVEVNIDGVKQTVEQVSKNSVNQAWQASYNSGGN